MMEDCYKEYEIYPKLNDDEKKLLEELRIA